MKTYNLAGKQNIDEHIRTFEELNICDLTDDFLATKLEDTNNAKNESKSISRKRLLLYHWNGDYYINITLVISLHDQISRGSTACIGRN